MSNTTLEQILPILRDPSAEPRAPDAAAHADAMLRGHVVARVGRALAADGLDALLVKGAALALTLYAPASRAMGDVDVLVRTGQRDRVVATLVREGGRVLAPPGRSRSAEFLGETVVVMHTGALTVLVEVHTTLDKIVPRPVDIEAVFARARAAPGLDGLLVPEPEDHALLTALHAASHELRHPAALLDLELLLRRGLDLAELARRARAYELVTAMYVTLSAMHHLGAASVSRERVALFRPGRLRRAIVDRWFNAATIATRGPSDLGLPWLLHQTALRDDLAAWARGVFHYGVARGIERLR